jgi:hypothetical protein
MPTGGTTSPNSTVRTGWPRTNFISDSVPQAFLLAVHALCREINEDLGTDHQPPERLSILIANQVSELKMRHATCHFSICPEINCTRLKRHNQSTIPVEVESFAISLSLKDISLIDSTCLYDLLISIGLLQKLRRFSCSGYLYSTS